MKHDSQLRNYPIALFKAALEGDCADQVLSSLGSIQNFWRQDAQFRSLILSKRISQDNKKEILTNALRDEIHPAVLEFIHILIENNCMNQTSYFYREFKAHYKKENKIVSINAHLSQELDEKNIDKFRQDLESSLKMTADLSVSVDPSLIGGIKLRIGNKFIDATVQGKMNRLKENLLQS